jgi:hypothetical protein
MQAIVDHKKDGNAVPYADQFVYRDGKPRLKTTTAGWFLCIQWKNGTTSWERLLDMKESKPIEVAEYAVSCAINHKPAFAWWAPDMLMCRNRIIAAVIKRKCKPEEKFGIKVPNTLAEALQFDHENGDTQWHEAVRKEIDAVKVAFHVIDDDEVLPPGYQQIGCHLIYTVKMENFRRKVRYVAGGHTTEAPASLTYASVISRESMRIALTMAALNDLEVKIGDIENTYLMVPVAEKIWTGLGPEFGDDSGKWAIVVRSLYRL